MYDASDPDASGTGSKTPATDGHQTRAAEELAAAQIAWLHNGGCPPWCDHPAQCEQAIQTDTEVEHEGPMHWVRGGECLVSVRLHGFEEPAHEQLREAPEVMLRLVGHDGPREADTTLSRDQALELAQDLIGLALKLPA